jgi:hypothetical protein
VSFTIVGELGVPLWWVVLVFLGFVLPPILSLWWVSTDKGRAVNLCIALSDVYGIGLTFWDVRYMQSQFFAEKVFTFFVGRVKELKPDLIRDDYFVGSGEGPTAYYYVLKHLWGLKSAETPSVEVDLPRLETS